MMSVLIVAGMLHPIGPLDVNNQRMCMYTHVNMKTHREKALSLTHTYVCIYMANKAVSILL